MKTYGYYLILHILGLTGLIAAGVLAMLHGLWFCTIICGLLLIGICYSLYRIQIRQTETMYRLVECMKQNDLGQRVCAPFADPQMQKLAEELSQALKNLRTRIVDEEVKHQYYEMLLNKVDTAVLVTDRSNRMEWMNKAARELLGHCAHLPEEISTAIQENQQVAHLQKGNATFDLSLSVTHIQLQGRTCRLISLKNIHGALEYQEMEAWQKLIRVLTHEIMNSITPIISLADTLNERSQEHPDDARWEERRVGKECRSRWSPYQYLPTARATGHLPTGKRLAGVCRKLPETDPYLGPDEDGNPTGTVSFRPATTLPGTGSAV